MLSMVLDCQSKTVTYVLGVTHKPRFLAKFSFLYLCVFCALCARPYLNSLLQDAKQTISVVRG
jgi:hypothetical protein